MGQIMQTQRLSIRAYARSRAARGLPGQTEGAVRKAIRGLRITPNPDGTIDPQRADSEWAARTLPRPEIPVVPPKEQRLLAALRGKARALGFAQAFGAHEKLPTCVRLE